MAVGQFGFGRFGDTEAELDTESYLQTIFTLIKADRENLLLDLNLILSFRGFKNFILANNLKYNRNPSNSFPGCYETDPDQYNSFRSQLGMLYCVVRSLYYNPCQLQPVSVSSKILPCPRDSLTLVMKTTHHIYVSPLNYLRRCNTPHSATAGKIQSHSIDQLNKYQIPDCDPRSRAVQDFSRRNTRHLSPKCQI